MMKTQITKMKNDDNIDNKDEEEKKNDENKEGQYQCGFF